MRMQWVRAQYKGPVILLQNAYSASGSEGFALAMKVLLNGRMGNRNISFHQLGGRVVYRNNLNFDPVIRPVDPYAI